jgi:hypothetical protein
MKCPACQVIRAAGARKGMQEITIKEYSKDVKNDSTNHVPHQ